MTDEYPLLGKHSLRFHGAVRGVTGSCHELRSGDESLLIDCGVFQGRDAGRGTSLAGSLDVKRIFGLVVTHAHLDHMGRIPELLAAGYKGPIFCSVPTEHLLPVQLEDTLRLGYTSDRRLIRRVLDRVSGQIESVAYDTWWKISERFRFRLRRAGHILGSAFVEVDCGIGSEPIRVVFSGDLGAPFAPLLPSPRSPDRAGVLVLESTYGDRNHEGRKHRKERLLEILKRALSDGGTVILPSFALGRTQELLYEMNALREAHRLADLPVILDSPLARRFTDVYEKMKKFWNEEAGRRLARGDHPFRFRHLHRVSSAKQHREAVRRLASGGGPAIVIASSGMCTGGRVLDYLKALLPDGRTDVIFSGYQAAGTRGRRLQTMKRGGLVTMDGERVPVRARMHTLSGYSAHGGQRDLIRWVRGIRKGPETVFLVHGETGAKERLKSAIARNAGRVIIPGRAGRDLQGAR